MKSTSKKHIKERIKFLEEEQKKDIEKKKNHNPYREENIRKLKEELKGLSKEDRVDDKVIEFLRESNAIEQEYSEKALESSIKAWQYALTSKFPYEIISIKLIKEIHRLLMKRLNRKIAGKIRKVDVWIGGRKGFNPEIIKKELQLLCNVVPYTEEDIKKWHIRFEEIHPFEDGNGRTGRIIMNLQRIKLKLQLLTIHSNSDEQLNYYKWFK